MKSKVTDIQINNIGLTYTVECGLGHKYSATISRKFQDNILPDESLLEIKIQLIQRGIECIICNNDTRIFNSQC